jgi:hypothetical protein
MRKETRRGEMRLVRVKRDETRRNEKREENGGTRRAEL